MLVDVVDVVVVAASELVDVALFDAADCPVVDVATPDCDEVFELVEPFALEMDEPAPPLPPHGATQTSAVQPIIVAAETSTRHEQARRSITRG